MRGWIASLLGLALLLSLPARADDSDIPPNAPPDIVRILKKTKSGQPPTPDEQQRLMQWISQVGSRAGLPGAPGQAQPEGIPARFSYEISYTWTFAKGAGHGSGHLKASATGLVYAVDGGNANYVENVANPSVGVAMFRLAPNLDGSGSYGCESTHGSTYMKREGSLSSVALMVELESTGTDALWPHGSSMGGQFDGTDYVKDLHTGTATTTSDHGEIGGLGCEFHDSPFAFEAYAERHAQGNPKRTPTDPRVALSYSTLSKAIRDGGTASVSGTGSYEEAGAGESWNVTTSVTITVRPKDLQLIVEPGDRDAYEKWLPLPDEKESGAPELFGKPKPFPIHAALHDPAKGPIVEAGGRTRPDADRGGRIDLYLSDVSRNKGVAMNFPPPGKGDDLPDLFFPKDGQPAGIHWVDESHVYTDSETAVEATALVAARDTGAYGKVRAECKALGTKSKSWESDDEFMSMPRDKNANHIADQWEKDHQIFDDNFPPDWDGENAPSLSTKGDDLVLFEEYRGFVLEQDPQSRQEGFRRLEPLDRELLVYVADRDRDLKVAGLAMLEKATGLHVRYLHSNARMDTGPNHTRATWVNFNQTEFSTGSTDKAFAVWVDDLDTYDSFEQCVAGVPEEAVHHPPVSEVVNVSRKNAGDLVSIFTRWAQSATPAKGLVDAATSIGEPLSQIGAFAERNHKLLVDRLVMWTTMHEVGHAIGGRHHAIDQIVAYDNSHAATGGSQGSEVQGYLSSGSHSCPMRYWTMGTDKRETLLFLSGKWDLTAPADGGAWKFCDADQPNIGLLPK